MKTVLFMDKKVDLGILSMKTGLFMDGQAGLGIQPMKVGLLMDRMTVFYKKYRKNP